MTRTITIQMEDMPKTCFKCDFAKKEYYLASCPFLQSWRKDGELTPSNCPLKLKNKNKSYNFNDDIYK